MPATPRFSAYLVSKDDKGICHGEVRNDLALDQLPPGELLIRPEYSSVNYKDALSATGNPGVTRQYPHIPGVDAVGTVIAAESGPFVPGDPVIVTGYRFGMDHWGGFAQLARVPAEWAVPLPAGLSPLESMRLGTAGFTAALAVEAILTRERHRGDAPILVTGATGGVAMIAIALLAKLGCPVTAVTRKEGTVRGRLRQLGAQEVLTPEQLEPGDKPLLKERWSGVVDTIGGAGLEQLIKSTVAGGVVTTCGMAAGNRFSSSVFPFILRGVTLAGIDSVALPAGHRSRIWGHLATDWHVDLERICTEIGLDGITGCVREILAGTHVGRTVVKV
ncbi:MAG: YhdH/YhfP family quinone oxidoreductase [Holophaga sp.]|nr:YhdH/YhfP family quinone oxidoreductase [Holophaga sp.]